MKNGLFSSGRTASRNIVFCLVLGLAFSSATAFGQTIIIDTNVDHSVYGNADAPFGKWDENPDSLKNPNDNKLTVKSGSKVENGADLVVIGGYAVKNDASASVSATGNTVSIIEGSNVAGAVIGGSAESEGSGNATATGNKVFIFESEVSGAIGGSAESKSGNSVSSDNEVNLEESSALILWGGAAGSESGTATASGNSVNISNGNIGIVMGGNVVSESGDAIASGNRVNISQSEVGFFVSGGHAASESGSATASGNSVNISKSSEVELLVSGGNAQSESGSATASGNSVNISQSVAAAVMGGSATSDDDGQTTASGNSVTVGYDADVGIVFGGEAKSENPSASDNASATASHNTVTISGGAVGNVVGGIAIINFSGSAVAAKNTVKISGGTVEDVAGGVAQAFSGGSALATGNSVKISGGNIEGDLYGGDAESDVVATASHNTVTISGGTMEGNVYGGRAETSGSGIARAINNTVTISGNPTFGGTTQLFGGGGGSDTFTGNTLNVWNFTGSSVAGVENFEFLNFVFPTSQSVPVLTVSGEAKLWGTDAEANVVLSTITASTIGGTAPLQPGARVTLIDAGSIDASVLQPWAEGRHGATLNYNWMLEIDDNGGTELLIATLDNVSASPETKALSEGFISGVALAAQGGDTVAGAGMENAVSATQGAGAGAAPVIAGFGAMSAGSVRVKSGSHVDMRSISLVAGFAWGRNYDFGRPTLGAFFEYGTGSYDTYNSFSNAASVKGSGDTRYYGGGILGRMDFTNNIYTEASARMGRIHNEYKSSDLGASYDSSTPYYGFHLGTGYIWNINEKASLDIYGKYFWTRVEGKSVRLSTGDPVNFKDADSSRLRLGSRFAYAVNEHVSPYIGAAYEHEFDGRARATTYGYSIDAPSIRGSTGIGELGLSLRPSMNMPLSFDLGVQGYTGKREGVTGSLQVKWTF